MKKHIFSLLVLSIITFNGIAQSCFKPGYVITNDNDTIHGRVDYRMGEKMSSVCTFKNKSSEKVKYYPGDISAYGFSDGRYFISSPDSINDQLRFIEHIVESDINIYFYEDTIDHYFIQRADSRFVELRVKNNNIRIDKNDNRKTKVVNDITETNTSSKNNYIVKAYDYEIKLRAFMNDVPEMTNEINDLKKVNHKNLIDLVNKYEEYKDNEDNVIVHYSGRPKRYVELSTSLFNIAYNCISQEEFHLMYGVKCFLPVYNDQFYFGAGIQYAKDNYTSYYSSITRQQNFTLIKVPFYLRYQYSGNIFKPYIGVGVNIYILNDQWNTSINMYYEQDDDVDASFKTYDEAGDGEFTFGINAGTLVKLYKSIYLTLNYSTDFEGFATNSNSSNIFFGHCFSAGIAYGF